MFLKIFALTSFWRKAMSRWDVPVNIQSALNLDGEAVTVYDPENLILPTQVLEKTTIYSGSDGVAGSVVGVDNTTLTVQPGLPIIQDEIEDSFTILFELATPVNILEMKEEGDLYLVTEGFARIAVTSGVNIDQISAGFWLQKNAETPINIGTSILPLGGVSSCDKLLAANYTHTFTDIEIGDLITFYIIYNIQLASVDTINYTVGVEDFTYTFKQKSIFRETQNPGLVYGLCS